MDRQGQQESEKAMTTTVYRLAPKADQRHSVTSPLERSSLVCHLTDLSPDEAIAKLQSVGVLAIPGPDATAITLVGYRVEVRKLLRRIRMLPTLSPSRRREVFAQLERLHTA
jgi:hypothetical protein